MLGEWNKCFPMLNHSISISAIGILLRFLTWEVCLEVPDHSINQSGTGIHQRLLPWKVCLKMPNHSTSQSGTGTYLTLKTNKPCLKEHFPTSIQNLGKLNNLKSAICNTFINDNRRSVALQLSSRQYGISLSHTIRLLIFIPFLNQVFWMLCYHIYLMCNHSILFCMYDWSLHWCSREYLLYPHLVLLIC